MHSFSSGIFDLFVFFSMCGDHPSFTKTELNAKLDIKMDEKDKDKAKDKAMSYAKITPTVSRVFHLLRTWGTKLPITSRS